MKNIYKKIISGLWELVAGGFYFFSFLYCKYLYMCIFWILIIKKQQQYKAAWKKQS